MTKIILISGGSGAGKTTLAKKIVESFGKETCIILSQDHYYLDQSSDFDEDGGAVNFDHPKSLDFILLSKHLHSLKANHSIEVPCYDFATHRRLNKTETMHPKKIIVVEGTLLLSQKIIRNESDIKIFIKTPESLRFERRMKRDIQERGREPQGIEKQFKNQVKPMHDEFVEPSIEFADIIVSNDSHPECIGKIKKMLEIL